MPDTRPRVDIHFTRKTRANLLKLKKEARERTGRFVSVSDLVEAIVSEFFDRDELAEKTFQDLQSQKEGVEVFPPR